MRRDATLALLLFCACAADDHAASSVGTNQTSRRDGGSVGFTQPRRTLTGGSANTPPSNRDASVPIAGGCTLPERPVDVIFIVDTSGSMVEEIAATEHNLNANFAAILDREGVDYRVVLVGDHGRSDALALRICISEPLSGGSCVPVPERPHNNERFRHYSTVVSSLDSLCVLLDGFDEPDVFGLAPLGWSGFLREGALKVFVEVTDDGVGCASARAATVFPMGDDPALIAESFDAELRFLAPHQFEDAGARDYRFYSIVGLSRAAEPDEALVTEPCASAETAGLEYQALSVLTSAMRYPVCEGMSFPEAFHAIASEVVKDALPCQSR
jgi:hypothetical protein